LRSVLTIDRESTRRPRTIHEFADAIGVSATTISRTLSGRGRVSPETRRMVLARMEELGYTPNATAQRLVTGRTQTVLFECGEIPSVTDLYMLEAIRGAQRTLTVQQFGLLLGSPNGDSVGTVVSGAVDGAILVADDDTSYVSGDGDHGITQAIAVQIAERGKPCVVIGHTVVPDPRVGSVVLDLEQGAREVARYLVQMGHRRIGFLAARRAETVQCAFRDELARLGAPLDPEYVIVSGNTVEHGEQGMQALLRLPKPPTVVFARNDTLASGARRGARACGMRVPEDVSLVGHDDVPFAGLMDPPLTTVQVNASRLGQAAAEMLIEMLDQPEIAPPARVVPTSLVVRETVVGLNPIQE